MPKHPSTPSRYTNTEVYFYNPVLSLLYHTKLTLLNLPAAYDYQTIHSIFASTLVSHVSFISTDEDGDPTPINLPLTAVLGRYDLSHPLPSNPTPEQSYHHADLNRPLDLYLHGNVAMMLRRAISKQGRSIKVCICSTKVDGVVLNFTPNGHSLNYRSAVIHGTAELVTLQEEKEFAMHLLTNHMIDSRWQNTNPTTASALKSIQVMRVTINSASAKVRAKNMGLADSCEIAAERDDVYTGVYPVYEVLGDPVESGYSPGRPVQEHLDEWRKRRNEEEKGYAIKAAENEAEEAETIVEHVKKIDEIRKLRGV
jgi:nitroimidazol reductase NimA-like FMN-containing flavoprotein (pyridoxamine 5'-phosphate oxidase superfamily)